MVKIDYDFIAIHGGSIITLRPLTPDAQQWIDEYVDLQPWQSPNHIAVERRYWDDIHWAINDAGMTVKA